MRLAKFWWCPRPDLSACREICPAIHWPWNFSGLDGQRMVFLKHLAGVGARRLVEINDNQDSGINVQSYETDVCFACIELIVDARFQAQSCHCSRVQPQEREKIGQGKCVHHIRKQI